MTRTIWAESRLSEGAICNSTIPRVDTDHGRFYSTDVGPLPSVTSVLGATSDQSWLKEWTNRVGEDAAKEIGERASTRGTAFHSMAASYLMGEQIFPGSGGSWMSFMAVWQYLDEISSVRMIESAVYSRRLRYAGTLDCLADLRGVRSLIDFKSYGRQKSVHDLMDAFTQCALYALSDQVEPLGVKQLTVIFGSESSSGCESIPFSEGIKMTARARVRDYWRQRK